MLGLHWDTLLKLRLCLDALQDFGSLKRSCGLLVFGVMDQNKLNKDQKIKDAGSKNKFRIKEFSNEDLGFRALGF